MNARIANVRVVGLGKVGRLVGALLGAGGIGVEGVDVAPPPDPPFPARVADCADPAALERALAGADAVVSCLPYHLNTGVAGVAHRLGLHYFDLTEDVATTTAIRALAREAPGVMAPQCGLAPGFIGIVGASLARGFERLRSIHLRVGALPRHPSGLLGYAFNWSPEGVVNEYLNECEVIAGGERRLVPPMSQIDTVFVDGVQLEAFTTSGGLGTMCETFEGRVQELDYKTLRYPGHCRLMRFFFHELHMRDQRREAGEILVNAKPPVNEDVVFAHAAVEGWRGGELKRDEFVRSYLPLHLAGERWRAISWTTAGSVCAVVELVARGALPASGFLRQEDIALADFLATRGGSLYRQGETAEDGP